MNAYQAGLMAGTVFAGFLLVLACSYPFRWFLGIERFRFSYPFLFTLPFLLLLASRFVLVESMDLFITLGYLAGAGLYFLNLHWRTRELVGKPVLIGSFSVLALGMAAAPFLNQRFGERTFVADCVAGGTSQAGFLSVLNSYNDAAGFCRCVRQHVEPASCYMGVGLVVSPAPIVQCRMQFQQMIANPEAKKAYEEAQDGCIGSQLGNQGPEVYAKIKDILQGGHVQVLLADANLKALAVPEQSKLSYANCFIGRVLNECAVKTLRGYSQCLSDGENPSLKAYVEECRAHLGN